MPIPNLSEDDFKVVLGQAPLIVVDVLIKNAGRIVLVKRGSEPFKGSWHIPGGFLAYGEDPREAVSRIAKVECGVSNLAVHSLMGAFSLKDKDPRGHLVSLFYAAETTDGLLARAGEEVAWFSLSALPPDLLWYHRDMILESV